MNKRNFLALLLLCAFALVGSGCGGTDQYGNKRGINVLGIYESTPGSYQDVGGNTFAVRSDELYNCRNFSGDRVDLFWGLITLADY